MLPACDSPGVKSEPGCSRPRRAGTRHGGLSAKVEALMATFHQEFSTPIHPKPSYFNASNPCRKPPASSSSTPNSRFPSTTGMKWKSTCLAPISSSPSRSTVRNTYLTRLLIAATGGRTPYSRKTAAIFFVSLAEDLGKHLDATLDAILRAIAHLRRKQ